MGKTQFCVWMIFLNVSHESLSWLLNVLLHLLLISLEALPLTKHIDLYYDEVIAVILNVENVANINNAQTESTMDFSLVNSAGGSMQANALICKLASYFKVNATAT